MKYNRSYAFQKRKETETIRRKKIDDRVAAKYDEQIRQADLEVAKAQEHTRRVELALAYQDEIDKKFKSHHDFVEQELAEIRASRAKREASPKAPRSPSLQTREARCVAVRRPES